MIMNFVYLLKDDKNLYILNTNIEFNDYKLDKLEILYKKKILNEKYNQIINMFKKKKFKLNFADLLITLIDEYSI